MPPLSPTELRVLGALVEKQISTPEYYPLSLNALVNACNQKNHRDPVVAFDESSVLRAIESLRLKGGLAYIFSGAAERVRKYGHNFTKALALDPAETAILCVLMLRGPQTPGELRSRTAHLHNFESLAAVETTLDRLAVRPSPAETSASEVSPAEALAKAGAPTPQAPLITKLPRAPGTKESRFTHLLAGEPSESSAPEISPAEARQDGTETSSAVPSLVSKSADFDLAKAGDPDRLSTLESQVTHLQQQLADLQAQFATFRQQFE